MSDAAFVRFSVFALAVLTYHPFFVFIIAVAGVLKVCVDSRTHGV